MALALPPSHHFYRDLHKPLPSPAFLLAPAAMGSYKPSLPPFRELMESVSEKAENDKGKGKPPSPVFDPPRRVSGSSQGYSTSPDRPDIAPSPRHFPPPTSELPPASNFDLPRPSPTNISPVTAPGRSDYYPASSTSTNPGLYAQRTSGYLPITTDPAQAYPPVPDSHTWTMAHPPRPVTDTMQQEQVSADPARFNGLTQQRPLPPSFPPPMQGAGLPPLEGMLPGSSLPPMDPQMPPTWQHHHFYPPANPPVYPQAQERYICPTCRKPFSRPSSLRIHGHSHSGEKPYVCKYPGCGKSFSVRSNMKRHERGCHGGESASGAGSGSINNGDSSATSR